MAGEWLAQLPEDLRANETFTGYATLGDFAKAHLETKGKAAEFDGKATQLTGQVTDLTGKLAKAIVPPGEQATPEEIATYRKTVADTYKATAGVPESPDKYDFGLDPAKYPDADKDPVLAGFKKMAHELGLPNDIAKAEYAWYDNLIEGILKEQETQIETARVEAEKKLKAEFGNDEVKFKGAMELADRLWKQSVGVDFKQFLADNGAIKNPFPILKVIFDLAKKTGEDFSPAGAHPQAGNVVPGIKYDKSPTMPGPKP